MTIKINVLEMMVAAHPKPVHRNTFLQAFHYSFRNRLSELRINNGINYDAKMAKGSEYKFATESDYQKALEYLGIEPVTPVITQQTQSTLI